MKNRIKLLCFLTFIIIAILIFTTCEEIGVTEKDISGKVVYLVGPVDSLETDRSEITFWWDPVNGATGYNLIVMSPNFELPEFLVLDTNITTTQFTSIFDPGHYEWGVLAYNSYYITEEMEIRYFRIDSSASLTYRPMVLVTPHDHYATRDFTILFQWQKIDIAEEYRFEIKYDSWGGQYVTSPHITTDDTVTYKLPREGTYVWGVMASNANSQTLFTTRTLYIDTTKPADPVIVAPLGDTAITELPFNLAWYRPDVTGSPIYDSLCLASDSIFTNENILKEVYLSDTLYQITGSIITESGMYYWRVKSIDRAGNKSNYTYSKFEYEE